MVVTSDHDLLRLTLPAIRIAIEVAISTFFLLAGIATILGGVRRFITNRE